MAGAYTPLYNMYQAASSYGRSDYDDDYYDDGYDRSVIQILWSITSLSN